MLPESLQRLDADRARRIALECIKATRKLAWVDHWFKRATVAVKDFSTTSFIDRSETLVPAMDDLEGDLLRLRAEILNMVNSLEALGGPDAALIRDTLRLSVRANADLFESVQAFKWAVMEHDYQADLLAGLIAESFGVLEDLLARLKG
ncbi:MAG: hypothetical protein JWR60_1002 [Polaromonas sp.]|nr:hypothetical protein [Polaromonas sp.]